MCCKQAAVTVWSVPSPGGSPEHGSLGDPEEEKNLLWCGNGADREGLIAVPPDGLEQLMVFHGVDDRIHVVFVRLIDILVSHEGFDRGPFAVINLLEFVTRGFSRP